MHRGAHLASVHSSEENDFVASLDTTNRGRWLGATARLGEFQWSDGSEFKYVAWYMLEPNNLTGDENCISMGHSQYQDNSKWNDARCSKRQRFVCKWCPTGHVSSYDHVTLAPSVTAILADGWIRRGPSEYNFFADERRSYGKASRFCAQFGAQLVSIEDEEENNFVAMLAPMERPRWIGLRWDSPQAAYLWEDGSSLVNYNNWYEDSPTLVIGKQQDCTIMSQPRKPIGGWDNRICALPRAFICERPSQ